MAEFWGRVDEMMMRREKRFGGVGGGGSGCVGGELEMNVEMLNIPSNQSNATFYNIHPYIWRA